MYSDQFQKLRNKIQSTYGEEILFSKDCIPLSEDLFSRIKSKISPQTLRRLFGFIKDEIKISNTSLQLLSNYCGYENYNDLLNGNTVGKALNESEVKYIKLFFSISSNNLGFDENYHNASKNISKLLFSNSNLLNKTSTYLSKNPAAQVYFFERFPYLDGICSGYEIHLKKYLFEKRNQEAQLFGNCLMYLSYALSNNSKRKSQIKLINSLPIEDKIHPFPFARMFASNIMENYLNNNVEELEYWISYCLKEANKPDKSKKEYINFPYFQFIIADVFNLIERPYEAEEILRIGELDYKRIPDTTLDEGYIEALDLIKAINLFQLGKISECKRMFKRINSKDIIFVMHDYFLIQRLIVELRLIKSKASTKYITINNQLLNLIEKTNFTFFLDKISKSK